MEIQRNLATVIRALKEQSGKSLTEFSEELEISRSALQEYLSGSGNPNVTTVEHLARKLNVDVSFLVSGVFSGEQIDVLLRLLDAFKLLSKLPPKSYRRFAELLIEMIQLWDGGDSNE